VSEDHRGTADRLNDGAQILGLPLWCVRRGVATVAPTATIIGNGLQASIGERGNGPAASAVDSAPPTKTTGRPDPRR
jgi:hypothetical protein